MKEFKDKLQKFKIVDERLEHYGCRSNSMGWYKNNV